MKNHSICVFIPCLLIIGCLVTGSLIGCSGTPSPENSTPSNIELRDFTDSTGRTVSVPRNITKVAVTGPLSQIAVFAICPDMLVGVCEEWPKEAVPFIDEHYLTLPCIGQLYGGKADFNRETLLMASPDVVIDIGESKGSIAEDFDSLTNQTGIPFIHIDSSLESMDEAYRMLGDLINRPDEAKILSAYCKDTYEQISDIASSVKKVRAVYIPSSNPLRIIAKESFQADSINLLCDNVMVSDTHLSQGTGNETDVEELIKLNPEVMILAPNLLNDTAFFDKLSNVDAVENNRCYEVPAVPYNWLGFPASFQRYLGIRWLAYTLYPSNCDFDMYAETQKFFSLFLHHELTEAEYSNIVKCE